MNKPKWLECFFECMWFQSFLTTTLHPGTIQILSLATCLVVDASVEVGLVAGIGSSLESDGVSGVCRSVEGGVVS